MIGDLQIRDSRCAAPEALWRSTIMLGPIASMLRAVSTSVSPLTTLELAMATPSVSALSRFSAISNEVRVRVDGSKNRLTTVRPRSVGTFLIARCEISFIASAVSRMSTISFGRQLGDAEQVLVAQRRRGRHALVGRGGHVTPRSRPTMTASWPSAR